MLSGLGHMDGYGRRPRDTADELYELVRGVCVLCLGWREIADRSRVELCGGRWGGAEGVSMVGSAGLDDDRSKLCGIPLRGGWLGSGGLCIYGYPERGLEVAERRRKVG